jgi:RNA polymerase sigma-70 factor (ECF subfamily)
MPRNNAGEGPARALVEHAMTHVGRWVRSSGIPAADVEDVRQEVLIKVIRHAHTYDAARPLAPWLGAIAFRTARDYRKRARHRHEVLMEIDDASREGPSFDPSTFLSNERVAELVAAVLEAIPEGRRDVLVRTARDGAPMAEIAAELGISIDAGYLRLRRARAQFKILWEGLTREPVVIAPPAPARR